MMTKGLILFLGKSRQSTTRDLRDSISAAPVVTEEHTGRKERQGSFHSCRGTELRNDRPPEAAAVGRCSNPHTAGTGEAQSRQSGHAGRLRFRPELAHTGDASHRLVEVGHKARKAADGRMQQH